MKASFLQNRIAACALALLCTLLWGTAFPFIKLGYKEFAVANGDTGTMLLFAGLRFTLAGLITLGVFFARQRRFEAPRKNEWKYIFALGSVQTFGQYLFTYIGIGYTTGANTSIITACASFFTVLTAPIFFKSDRLTVIKILGCAVGFGGVLAMNGGFGFDLETLFGDVMILFSTVFAAGGNLIAKQSSKSVDPVKLTAYQLLFGGLALTAVGLISGGRLDLLNIKGLLILLWLAVVSAAAFSIWTALLKHHPAGNISVFNLLVPVFGTALSGLLLGESVLNLQTLLALALISAGIVLVNIKWRANYD